MATCRPARRWRNAKAVIVTDMTEIAGHRRMAIGQWESGGAVVEYSRCPSGDRMARCALCGRRGKSSRDVIRNASAQRCCALEIRLMATVTIG